MFTGRKLIECNLYSTITNLHVKLIKSHINILYFHQLIAFSYMVANLDVIYKWLSGRLLEKKMEIGEENTERQRKAQTRCQKKKILA